MTCHHTRSESKPYCVACDPVDVWLHLHDTVVVKRERERIILNILDRVNDLRSCTKKDNCRELADLIESYIPEWTQD